MKIAVISFFHTESSLCLAKYLAKQGVEVDYYFVANLLHDRKGTSGFEYPHAKRFLGNHRLNREEVPEVFQYMENLPVRLFFVRILHHSRYPVFHRWLVWLLMTFIKWKHYDAINIIGQYSWIETAHDVLKKENLIHTFHELGNKDGELIPLAIVKRAIQDGSKVILHSKSMYNRFMSLPGSNVTRARMIPFGKFETCKLYVDEKNITLPFNNNNPVLLFYGYILPYKGLDILSQALELLKKDWDKFNIVIAGDGEDSSLPYLSSLSNSFVLNRYLSNSEMMNLIRQSSVVLLPYKSVSQTGIISTCTLYGKPVIATKVGAFTESIIDGVNGLLVDPNDSVKFAEAIKSVIYDPILLKKISNGTLNYGNGDSFDWNNIAKQALELYKA